MTIEYKQPSKDEFTYIMDDYWFMMSELERIAQDNNDAVLRHFLDAYFKKWSEFAGLERKPVWS